MRDHKDSGGRVSLNIRETRIFLFIALGVLVSCGTANAATTIDGTNKYAYGENIGWINFGTSEGNVDVGDTELTGYAWGENIGWISLNCSNTNTCGTVDYKVLQSATGTLTGYGYGENIGWLSFNCIDTASCGTVDYGVTHDTSSGDFSGYAWGENIGWISFNCSNTSSCGSVSYKLATGAAAPAPATAGSMGSGGTCANCFEPTPSQTPTTPSNIITNPPLGPPQEATVTTLIPPVPEAGPGMAPVASRFSQLFDFRSWADQFVGITKIGRVIKEGTRTLVQSIKNTIENFVRAFLRKPRIPETRVGEHPDPNTALILDAARGWREPEE